MTFFDPVGLRIPRDREGDYYPPLHKLYSRLVDVGVVVVALYAAGVPQRKAAGGLSLLLGHRYSHEIVSGPQRPGLAGRGGFPPKAPPAEMPSFTWTACTLKVFREGEGMVREVIYVALGGTTEGQREILCFWLLPAETALGGRSYGSGGLGRSCFSSPTGFLSWRRLSGGFIPGHD